MNPHLEAVKLALREEIDAVMPHHAGQVAPDVSDHFAPPAPKEHGGLLHKLVHSGSDMAASYSRGHEAAAGAAKQAGKLSIGGQAPEGEKHPHAWHAGYHMHNMLAGAGLEK